MNWDTTATVDVSNGLHGTKVPKASANGLRQLVVDLCNTLNYM